MKGERGQSSRIKRHPIGEIHIYEVTKEDLQKLSDHSEADIYLNFSIAALSFFVAFGIALLTCDMRTIVFLSFVMLTSLFGFLGLLSLAIWFDRYKKYKTFKKDFINHLERL